jgi:hypothetical protein
VLAGKRGREASLVLGHPAAQHLGLPGNLGLDGGIELDHWTS